MFAGGRDSLVPVPKCPRDTVRTFRHQFDGAEMSWVRSVLGPKCLDTGGTFNDSCHLYKNTFVMVHSPYALEV